MNRYKPIFQPRFFPNPIFPVPILICYSQSQCRHKYHCPSEKNKANPSSHFNPLGPPKYAGGRIVRIRLLTGKENTTRVKLGYFQRKQL